jgi:Transposase
MAPRTILGTIDGNRGVRKELTPNQRGKIEGARLAGATFKVASEIAECALSTAKTTIRRAPERHDGISKPRSGRPKEWDARFERRVVRIVRMHPRITYAQMRDQLHTYLSHDTLARILNGYHISKWLSKQRPYLTAAAVKSRLRWALHHADWT